MTAFLLNVAKLNQDRYEIVYLNSEMGDTEFRKRLEKFEDMKLTDWKMKAFFRAEKFEDVITDAKKIFIIDYLELNKDFYRVAETIQAIHKKLKDGICIIALQKDPGHELGRGNTFSIEKSRLYLTLDRVPGQKMNRLKIVSAKAWRTAQNPRDMFRNYSLVNGSKFITQGNWAE